MKLNTKHLARLIKIAEENNVPEIDLLHYAQGYKAYLEFKIDEETSVEGELHSDNSELDKIIFHKKTSLKE